MYKMRQRHFVDAIGRDLSGSFSYILEHFIRFNACLRGIYERKICDCSSNPFPLHHLFNNGPNPSYGNDDFFYAC